VTALPPFQTVLDDHAAAVMAILHGAVGREGAEDCFQETFLAALRAYPKLRDAENLRGWVLTIAGRKAIDAGRSRGRRPLPVGEVPDRPAAVNAVGRLPFDPVWDAVRELPVRQRVALIQRVVLDRSYADVALDMGGTEETARANVYQALKKLRTEVTRS